MSYPATAKHLADEVFTGRFRLEFSERKFLLRIGDLFLIAAGIICALALWTRIAMLPLDSMLLRDQFLWIGLITFGWIFWLSINDLYDLLVRPEIDLSARRIALGGLLIGIAYIIYFYLSALPLTAVLGLAKLSALAVDISVLRRPSPLWAAPCC